MNAPDAGGVFFILFGARPCGRLPGSDLNGRSAGRLPVASRRKYFRKTIVMSENTNDKLNAGSGAQPAPPASEQSYAELSAKYFPKPPKKEASGLTILLRVVTVGVIAGLIFAMCYLFMLRERDSADEYLFYFQGVATAIELYKNNSQALVDRAVYLIANAPAGDRAANVASTEVYLKEKEEFYFVISENIGASEYAMNELDKAIAPAAAAKARAEMKDFFIEAKKCLEMLKSAVEDASLDRAEAARFRLVELSSRKITGYRYEGEEKK